MANRYEKFISGGKKGKGALGLGLSLGPAERVAFRQAAAAGDLTSYFADKPATAALFASRLGRTGNRGIAARHFAERGNFVPGTGELGPAPVVLGAGAPASAPPGIPMTPEELIRTAGGQLGPSAQGINDYIQGRVKRMGDGPELPTFEDMFNRWLSISRGEAERNAASITESFGARGARYGSDLLRAKADYGKEFLNTVMSKADEVGLGLRNARTAEEGGLLAGWSGIAGMEQASRNESMQRLFLDSMRLGGLPPALTQAFSGTAGVTGDTVVYPK